MILSNNVNSSEGDIRSKQSNISNVTVNIVDSWSKKKRCIGSSKQSSQPTPKQISNTEEDEHLKPRRLQSFNVYLTSDDKVDSVNEYSDSVPDKIEGVYKHDFNILEAHQMILKKFKHQRDYEFKKLEERLVNEERKINNRQNMIERKASLRAINEIKTSMNDIINNKSLNEYLEHIQPLIDSYSLLGSLSKIVSFAKIKRDTSESDSDDELEDFETQVKRHQLILDFIEIARRYIQIDLIREIKEGNNCPACGTKLDQTMSSADDDGISVCPNCGIEKISIIQTRTYHDNARTNNSGNNYEDRANYRKVLMRYQGKEPDKPPPELYQKLEDYFIENEIPKIDIDGDGKRRFAPPEFIRTQIPLNQDGEKEGTSRSLMFKALKDIGCSEFYDHINVILNTMWGWELPDISHLEDQILEDYDESQPVYEALPKDRKSSLNTQFRLYKDLRRLGHPCKAKDFRIPTTHDILEFHNTMWAKMCEVLNWENI